MMRPCCIYALEDETGRGQDQDAALPFAAAPWGAGAPVVIGLARNRRGSFLPGLLGTYGRQTTAPRKRACT